MIPWTTYHFALISASCLLWACGEAVSDAGSSADSNATNTEGVAQGGAASSATGTEGSSQTTSADPTRDFAPELLSACERVAAANCDTLERCNPVSYGSHYPDRDSCERAFAAPCVGSLEVVPNIEVSELDSCAGAVGNLSCADWLSNVDPSECHRRGERTSEEECAEDWQCASGFCYLEKCQEPGAEESEACTVLTLRPCQDGLMCAAIVQEDGSTLGLCTKPLAPDDPCDHPSSACPFPTACVDGSCVEPEAGSPCDYTSHPVCGSRWAVGTCDTGNCSGGSCPGVCAEYELVGVGEQCGQHLVCDATTYCSMGHLSWKGTCYARPQLGESCEQPFNVTPPECVVGARCLDDICVAD